MSMGFSKQTYYNYATAKFQKMDKRSAKVEEEILAEGNAFIMVGYALDVIKGRWPKAELFLMDFPHGARLYALDIFKGRWPKAEKTIRSDPSEWRFYLEDLNDREITVEDEWKWLKKEGVTDELFDVLNHIGMPRDVQDYVVKRRPDLIGKITDLDYWVELKYGHEFELAGVDL